MVAECGGNFCVNDEESPDIVNSEIFASLDVKLSAFICLARALLPPADEAGGKPLSIISHSISSEGCRFITARYNFKPPDLLSQVPAFGFDLDMVAEQSIYGTALYSGALLTEVTLKVGDSVLTFSASSPVCPLYN